MAGSELHTTGGLAVHLDEDGAPCARHPAGVTAGLLHLAAVGSRSLAVHHDQASRLQSLMMAVEEIGELASATPDQPDLRAAAETAMTALTQLGEMFAANRAFARTTERTRIALTVLLTRAARRAGVAVELGTLVEVEVQVSPAMAEHAFALLLEVLGADVAPAGKVTCVAEVVGDTIELTLTGGRAGPLRPQAADLVTVACYALGRDHGEIRCARVSDPPRFVVRLPA